MAKQRLTDKTAAGVLALSDLVHVVDVSDTGSHPLGTSKKATLQQIKDLIGGAGSTTYEALTDTDTLVGNGLKLLRVNAGGTATEHVAQSTLALSGFNDDLTYIASLVEDTSPQAGGNIDLQSFIINTSVVDGNISLQPNGTGDVLLGTMRFDADQTIGAGQDNYVLTYDNATGKISLEAAAGGGADGNGIYDGSGSLSAITTITNAGFDLNLLGTGNFNVGASGIAAKLGVQGDAGQDIARFRDSSNVSRFYQDSQGKVTIQGQNGGVKNFRVLNNAGDETFVVGSTGDAARVHLTSAGDTSRFAVNRSDPRCAGDFSSKGHPNDIWSSMNFDQIPILAQSNNTPVNSWMGIQYRNDTETTIASLDVQIKAGNQSDFWMVPSSSGTFNIGRPDATNPIFKCDRAAQSVGVNTTTIDASAVVDIVSTTKGFLPPRMTTAERDAITSPATGLVIYNTTTNVLNFYNGTVWGAV